MSAIDILCDWFANNGYKYQVVKLSSTNWYIYLSLKKGRSIINHLPVLIDDVKVSIPEWVGEDRVALTSIDLSDPESFNMLLKKINVWES